MKKKTKWIASQIKDVLTSFPAESSRMKKIWLVALAAMVLLVMGCSNGADEDLSIWKIEDGVLVKYDGADEYVTIPADVKKIGDGAFKGRVVLKGVTIPQGVTSIGNEAFCKCRHLTTLEIPVSLTSIGEDAFVECRNLKTVTYKGTLAQWCSVDHDNRLNSNAQSVILAGENNLDLKMVTELDIPNGVEDIVHATFFGYKRLTRVTIPEGVTRIGSIVFLYCTGLTEVTIPCSMKSFGWGIFAMCKNLKDVRYGGTKAEWAGIKKDKDWDIDTDNYTIHCTDGIITK